MWFNYACFGTMFLAVLIGLLLMGLVTIMDVCQDTQERRRNRAFAKLKGTGKIPGGKWFRKKDGSLTYTDWWNVSPVFECIGGDSPEDPIVLG